MRIACLLGLAFLLGSCGSRAAAGEAAENCLSPRTLYVIRHGKHAGIAVKSSDLVALLPSLEKDIGRDGYVEIGWGEERYYQAGTGTVSLALRAAFWPNASVLQLVAFPDPPSARSTQTETVELPVDETGYGTMLAFVAGSFTRAPDGAPVRLGPALYGKGWFYRAEGSFHLLNNCNNRAAKAIEATGYPASSLPTLTAGGLLAQVRESASRCRP